ncbi:MAG TPA: HNH endonuclease, partial [Ignavibacteria bacterium]
MVYLEKSQPAPDCLEIEKAKANGNYRSAEVLNRLKNDFKNKCYICEYKEPVTINVEHFRPHKGNKDLEFDWNNLFWACGHCNNIKLAKFDNILNCTDLTHNIEKKLKYVF